MSEAKNSKQQDLANKHFWSFGFRYCLGFSASARDELGRVDLGFDPRLNFAQ
jgi:hypothetical protein